MLVLGSFGNNSLVWEREERHLPERGKEGWQVGKEEEDKGDEGEREGAYFGDPPRYRLLSRKNLKPC